MVSARVIFGPLPLPRVRADPARAFSYNLGPILNSRRGIFWSLPPPLPSPFRLLSFVVLNPNETTLLIHQV